MLSDCRIKSGSLCGSASQNVGGNVSLRQSGLLAYLPDIVQNSGFIDFQRKAGGVVFVAFRCLAIFLAVSRYAPLLRSRPLLPVSGDFWRDLRAGRGFTRRHYVALNLNIA